ncbi:MAG: 4a-hydroxytetrahydrobiopterin dehydratase [Agarilytica sp.]
MTELSSGVCEPCRVGAPRLSDEELVNLSSQIPEWRVVEVGGVKQLHRQFSFENFVSAITFANKVGDLAEAQGHHPALLIEWGRVKVMWWTHKIDGLHKNDVIMSAKTDQIFSA